MSLFYPTKCLLCSASVENSAHLCPSCAKAVRTAYRFDDTLFVPNTEGAVAALLYKDTVAQAMKEFKFQNKRFYAPWFAANTVVSVSAYISDWMPDYITYIPIGLKRKHERGYNQSELLANEIAARVNIPCIKTLKKRLFVKKQSSLQSPTARKENTKNAFLPACKIDLTGKNILLIDDVITTGASISSAASVLKQMGAEKVYAAAPLKTPSK